MRKILIVGATSTIAEQTARRFAANGDALFLTGRNEARLTAIADDLKVRSYKVQERDGENSGLHIIVVNENGLDGAADKRREGIVRMIPPN